MKKITLFTILCLFALILTACGQGNTPIDSDESTDGVQTEENTKLTESDIETGSDHNQDTNTQPKNGNNVNKEGTNSSPIPVELFFSDADVMDIYRVERLIEAPEEELFKATLQAWVDGPTEDNLVSLIPEHVVVQSVEQVEGVAHVSFTSEILDANVGSGPEEMLLQQIAMTMKQFGFNETQILVNGEVQPELFGHIDTSIPIEANNPSDYDKIE